jgi:alpha-galactosidase
MGWNGYNFFGSYSPSSCDPGLDRAKVEAITEAMIMRGMQRAGYTFVNLDACWELPERTADGQRAFDPERLPGGVESLSKFVHDRGFSLGVWAPSQFCRRVPGSMGFEAIDAQSYAAWGVDYVKTVICGLDDADAQRAVSDLATALASTGRSIVLSLGAAPFREWMRDTVQLWRTSGDSEPTWSSIVRSIDATVPLAAYARPGAFNDPDMMEIGNGGLTASEERVQFSVWSILSAPLIAGNDPTRMSEETRAVLTNAELIAVNQDPLGLQAALIRRDGDVDVLAKPLAACGARAVVLWNRGETAAEVSLTWPELWLEPQAASVRDLWQGAMIASRAEGFSVTVEPHDAVALRIQGVEPPLPNGDTYLSDLKWTYATNGWGPIELDRTNGEQQALDGHPIRLGGETHSKGLGVHGPSLIRYRLGQACSRFTAQVGLTGESTSLGSAQFEVWADGERLFQSGVMTAATPPRSVDVPVTGRGELRLFVGIGGDTYELDHAVWAGATLECNSRSETN